MSNNDQPSYTDLVHEVLISAEHPLTFNELFAEVDRRRPVTTRNPQSTLRNALTQSKQLVNTGDGRYGYLPRLVNGSVVRVPLLGPQSTAHELVYPHDAQTALWPRSRGNAKYSATLPIEVRLPSGDEIVLTLDSFGPGIFGSGLPEPLHRYLVKQRAKAGDALLFRVINGEAGRSEAWFEARSKRDGAAVTRRNQQLADAALEILRRQPTRDVAIWDLDVALLARGLYRTVPAPDPLETVLSNDARFVDAGMCAWQLAEFVTPEKEELIARRKGMEVEFFPLGMLQPDLGGEQPVARPRDELDSILDGLSPLQRRSLEHTFGEASAILARLGRGTPEEAAAKLRTSIIDGLLSNTASGQTDLDRADDLVTQAHEAATRRQRVRLAKKAIEVCPDCVAAYVLLAEESRLPKQAAALYTKAVAAGERVLGKEVLQRKGGRLWDRIEARPYLAARLGLAQSLWLTDQQEEAIEDLWDILRLNKSDNQGVRYLLLSWLLEQGDNTEAERLLSRYPKDPTASWSYGRALHAFQSEGDSARARSLRTKALESNRLLPDYLLGHKSIPDDLPDRIGFGDESEAVSTAAEQIAAWRQTPGALAWLKASLGGRST